MNYRSTIQIVSAAQGEATTFDLAALSELTGLQQDMIRELAQARLVDPVDPDGLSFDERGLLRLRQIAALSRDRAVNLRTLRLFVDLLDRLEAAQSEMRRLREELR